MTSRAPPVDEARVQQGLSRLTALLPLVQRQSALPEALRGLHRRVLRSFAASGHASAALAEDCGGGSALQQLADADLLVLDGGGRIVGAYPFTTEATDYRLQLAAVTVNAMCAVDALAVAPVFQCETRIASRCGVTGTPVALRQRGSELLEATPADLRVGVHWREPDTCAAHSLCREMLFLWNDDTAWQWRGQAPAHRSVYPVCEAMLLGQRFFAPLLQNPPPD